MASSTIYLVVVLTAMQVGLGTNMLKENHAFQRASCGYIVFSILGPLIIAADVVVVFVCLFMNNWIATLRFKRMRVRHIDHDVGREMRVVSATLGTPVPASAMAASCSDTPAAAAVRCHFNY